MCISYINLLGISPSFIVWFLKKIHGPSCFVLFGVLCFVLSLFICFNQCACDPYYESQLNWSGLCWNSPRVALWCVNSAHDSYVWIFSICLHRVLSRTWQTLQDLTPQHIFRFYLPSCPDSSAFYCSPRHLKWYRCQSKRKTLLVFLWLIFMTRRVFLRGGQTSPHKREGCWEEGGDLIW